jgi:hypothetical protein
VANFNQMAAALHNGTEASYADIGRIAQVQGATLDQTALALTNYAAANTDQLADALING